MANVTDNADQQKYAGIIFSTGYNILSRSFSSAQASLLAAMMVAQSKNESAHYTSNVFNKYKNAFGYGFKGAGVYKDYGLQLSIDYGASDVANWIIKRKADFVNVSTCLQYATSLAKNDYFEGEPASKYGSDMQTYYVPATNIIAVQPGFNWRIVPVALLGIVSIGAAIKYTL